MSRLLFGQKSAIVSLSNSLLKWKSKESLWNLLSFFLFPNEKYLFLFFQVACCVADILRIFAPEAPYKDPSQIKTIFYFLIKQLGGLKDPKDTAFKRYFYLLENLAYVKSFNMCLDLEDCNEVFCALFTLMFKIVNDEHSGKVKIIIFLIYFQNLQVYGKRAWGL